MAKMNLVLSKQAQLEEEGLNANRGRVPSSQRRCPTLDDSLPPPKDGPTINKEAKKSVPNQW